MTGLAISFVEAAGADNDDWIVTYIDPPLSTVDGAGAIARRRLGLDRAACQRIAQRKADGVEASRSFFARDGAYIELRDASDIARLAVRDYGQRYRVEPGCDLPAMTRLRARLPSLKKVKIGRDRPTST